MKRRSVADVVRVAEATNRVKGDRHFAERDAVWREADDLRRLERDSIPRWDEPSALILLTTKITKTVVRGKSRWVAFVDDAISTLIEEFLAMAPNERPTCSSSYAKWAYSGARNFCRSQAALYWKTHADEPGGLASGRGGRSISGETDEVSREDALQWLLFSQGRISRTDQETTLFIKQILEAAEALPAKVRHTIRLLIDGADVMDMAEDNETSLYEAMADQRLARTSLIRLIEDNADERRFGGGDGDEEIEAQPRQKSRQAPRVEAGVLRGVRDSVLA
jgi:hypothetical protein